MSEVREWNRVGKTGELVGEKWWGRSRKQTEADASTDGLPHQVIWKYKPEGYAATVGKTYTIRAVVKLEPNPKVDSYMWCVQRQGFPLVVFGLSSSTHIHTDGSTHIKPPGASSARPNTLATVRDRTPSGSSSR